MRLERSESAPKQRIELYKSDQAINQSRPGMGTNYISQETIYLHKVSYIHVEIRYRLEFDVS